MNTKLLRQKILDLAIRGKLTDQRKSDGTAADLLKDIAEAKPKKNGVILSGARSAKSKDPKQIIPLDKSEAPFEIPDNWEWVKLGDLCNASSGKTPSTSQKEFWNGNVLWVTSKDVKQKYIDSTQICLSDLGASSMQLYPPKTMIIVGRSGILRHSLPVAILKKGATINQDLKALVFKDDRVVEFVYSVIKGMEQHLLHEYKKAGTTVDNLNFDLFLTAPIPLPPLAEQQRIVAKIEEAFAEIDAVEKNKDLLKTHIKQTRQKILDLAIHGKLVPQDENDEPASVLLEKILQEKAQSDNKKHSKKNKTTTPATSDNRPYEKIEDVPFEIPCTWEWVRLGMVCEEMESTRPKGDVFKYIDIDSIDNTICKIKAPKILETKNAPCRASRYTKKGDVLFSLVRPYLRNIAKVEEDGCIASTGFYICSPQNIDADYCFHLMTCHYVVDGLNQYMKGDNSPSISSKNVIEYPIPLPPLAEQRRIVNKIKELFSELELFDKE